MTDKNCAIETLAKYLKSDLMPVEQKKLLEDAMEEFIQNGNKMPLEQASAKFNDEIKEMMELILEEQTELMRSVALTALRKSEMLERMGKYADAGEGRTLAQGYEAETVGTQRPIAGARKSLDSRSQAMEKMFLGGLKRDLRMDGSGDLWKLLKSGDEDIHRQVAREMFEFDKQGSFHKGIPTLDDSPALRAAYVINKWQKRAVDWQNANGAYIKNLPGYIVRQSHDMLKLRGTHGMMGAMSKMKRWSHKAKVAWDLKMRDRWVEFIYPKLDYGRTFKDLKGSESAIKYRLGEIWEELKEGRHIHSSSETDLGNIAQIQTLADRASAKRTLHFKTADDWFNYDLEYGQGGDLLRSVSIGLDKAARNIAVMEKYGPDPDQVHADIMLDMDKAAKQQVKLDPEAAAWSKKDLKGRRRRRLTAFYREAVGATRIPADSNAARIASNIRKWINLSKLGSAFVSSWADVPLFNREVRRLLGPTHAKGYLEAMKNLTMKFQGAERREIVEMLGAGAEGMRNEMLSRFSVDETPGGLLMSLQNTLFKYSLLQGWTDAHKAGLSLIISNKLGMMSDKKWGQLGGKHDIGMREMLEAYGIDEGKWELLRSSVRKLPDGRKYMTTDMLTEITSEDIAKHLGLQDRMFEAGTRRRIGAFRRELEVDFRAFIIDRTEHAVATPGARERAFITRGYEPGTVMGEMMRFFGQFKSFPLTVTNKLIGGDIRGQRAGGRGFRATAKDVGTAMLPGARKGGSLIGTYLIGLTIFGGLAMSAKELARGIKPRAMNYEDFDGEDWSKFLMASFVQGGGAGIYGDLILGTETRYGHSILEQIAGPGVGLASDSLSLMKVTGDYMLGKTDKSPTTQAMYFAKNNTPFMNMWYTKASLDYLLWYSAMESLKPGALRKKERKMKKDNQQEFMLSPRRYSNPYIPIRR